MLSVEDINFTVLEVLRFERNGFVHDSHKRNRTALSCRLSGESHFVCRGEELIASPKNYILIPANTEYSQESGKEEVICVHLDIKESLPPTVIGLHDASPKLRECFLELHRTWSQKEPGYILHCKSLVYEILCAFCSVSETNELSEAQTLLRPAMEYLHGNFCRRDCSLSHAIALAHVSPAYFRRVLWDHAGAVFDRTKDRLCQGSSCHAHVFYATDRSDVGLCGRKIFLCYLQKGLRNDPHRLEAAVIRDVGFLPKTQEFRQTEESAVLFCRKSLTSIDRFDIIINNDFAGI